MKKGVIHKDIVLCKKRGCTSMIAFKEKDKHLHVSYREGFARNKKWKTDIDGFYYCPNCYKKHLI